MKNRTLIQFFEWYLPANGQLWVQTTQQAQKLTELGFTDIWLPPAYKCAAGIEDVGYGVYDMYDLGEFNQKGTIPTKYGTKDEYLTAIRSLQRAGLRVYADVVFNHRMGADATENVVADIYDNNNRTQVLGEREIAAWTRFTFDARGSKYSDFTWNHSHFDGCDWDERTQQKALYLFKGKSWDDGVDNENGNFDYLMGADLDLGHEETFEELVRWGKWYLDFTGVDGFRVDAVKHINFAKMLSWVHEMRDYSGKKLFVVGEYWHQSLESLNYYLNRTAHCMKLFDVPLHYNLHKASISNGTSHLGRLLEGTLVAARPERAVTIVDNHDTQPGQALQSWVEGWFKLHAYALILLMQHGMPCVFYGDLYGIPHCNISPVGEGLEKLLKVRKHLAYGEQINYFDDSSVVGFTRLGEHGYDRSGLAVVMTDGAGGSLNMCMGESFIGKTLIDCLGNSNAKIVVGKDGCADFPVSGGSVSVYVDERWGD